MRSETLFVNKDFHLLESDAGKHLFVVNGSRMYDIPDNNLGSTTETYKEFVHSIENEINTKDYIGKQPLSPPKLASLSLNVAQGCNLSCSYCYADEGKFQKHSRLMEQEVSRKSIERLFKESEPNGTVVIGFMGGEPLLNRPLIYDAVAYAGTLANTYGKKVKYSLTTNGTLLTKKDVELFANNPFTVCVSIDGTPQTHNQYRFTHGRKGSYEKTLEKLELFREVGRPDLLSARSTVTPKSLNLLESLDHLVSLGFDDVGFSPVLVSPNPQLAFKETDFEIFLSEMIKCGEKAVEKILKQEKYPFSNLETSLFEIHRGSHRPYSCGAGAGYMSVNAEGDLYACHRLIDDSDFFMGNIESGLLNQPREALLKNTFVDRVKPCNSCWARYLCGGGCHHEVKHRGRVGCDYIRNWLLFCLSAYIKIENNLPSYFNKLNKPQNG